MKDIKEEKDIKDLKDIKKKGDSLKNLLDHLYPLYLSVFYVNNLKFLQYSYHERYFKGFRRLRRQTDDRGGL